MSGRAKLNAMRSGIVVLGALAFGYLTLHIGFKPFLENAQRTIELEQQRQQQQQQQQQQKPNSNKVTSDADPSAIIIRD